MSELESVLKSTSKEEFAQKYGRQKPDIGSPIIFSCRSGRRSAEAQAISQQLGYKK